MKKSICIALLTTLLFSCGTSLPISEQIDSNTVKIKIGTTEYVCNVEIINNAMPTMSTEHNNSLYSIVTLNTPSENLKENWIISRFEFEGDTYNQFDVAAFAGKDQPVYRNVVRGIRVVSESPVLVKIQFESDAGDVLDFELSDVNIQVVH